MLEPEPSDQPRKTPFLTGADPELYIWEMRSTYQILPWPRDSALETEPDMDGIERATDGLELGPQDEDEDELREGEIQDDEDEEPVEVEGEPAVE